MSTIGSTIEFFPLTSGKHPRGPVIKLFGGDHKECKHDTRTCDAKHAWSLNVAGDLVPRLVQHPDNDRAAGFYTVGEGRRSVTMPIWEHFGNRPWAEAENVRPSLAVRRFLVDRARKELTYMLRLRKVSLTEEKVELREFDEKHAPLLTDDVPRLTKPSRGSK